MTCPVCFFREPYQKQLKKQSFGINRFELKLKKYKELFLQEVQVMDSLSKCSCNSIYNDPEMIIWTDEFLNVVHNSSHLICSAFDNIISVYECLIKKNQNVATLELFSLLNDQHLLTGTISPLIYSKLLFRARKKPVNDQDIKEYFHIPFSMRHQVANQRFSLAGQPMLYFGSSVLAIAKELDLKTSEMSIAAFLPSYSVYFKKRVFDLTNYFGNLIENTLPAFISGGVNHKYDVNDISKDIHKAILAYVCTFPTEIKGSFIAEYAIPQMLTSILLENNYAGVIYPSTKDYSDLNRNHHFSSHHLNVGLFVPYDKKNIYNEDLFNTFTTFIFDGSENLDLTKFDVLDKSKSVCSLIKNNDYNLSITHLKLHIDYMSNSVISGAKYFETDIGKIELELYMKMLCYLENCVNC